MYKQTDCLGNSAVMAIHFCLSKFLKVEIDAVLFHYSNKSPKDVALSCWEAFIENCCWNLEKSEQAKQGKDVNSVVAATKHPATAYIPPNDLLCGPFVVQMRNLSHFYKKKE